jgi:hypothetical protein
MSEAAFMTALCFAGSFIAFIMLDCITASHSLSCAATSVIRALQSCMPFIAASSDAASNGSPIAAAAGFSFYGRTGSATFSFAVLIRLPSYASA